MNAANYRFEADGLPFRCASGQAAVQAARYAYGGIMDLKKWEFKEEPWWDNNYQAVKFAAENAGTRYICAISRIALNDYFRTEDTMEVAFSNYREHSDMVHAIAIRAIQETSPNEEGVFFITTDFCKKYWV